MTLFKYDISIGSYNCKYYLANNLLELSQYLLDIESDNFIFIFDNDAFEKILLNDTEDIRKVKRCEFIKIKVSESNKNLVLINEIIEQVISLGVTTSTCLFAVGGGVLGNIVGLTASLLFRGIKLVYMPTNVLSAIDSSLSAKIAVNSKTQKSSIGTYYLPHAIFCSYVFLKTLPISEYRAGLAELVVNILVTMEDTKRSIFGATNQFAEGSFEHFRSILEMAIRKKISIIKNDPYEKHKGILLKYGHTIGNAIEFLSKGNIKHGEGVSYGLLISGEISYQLGLIDQMFLRFHYEILDEIKIIKQIKAISNFEFEEVIAFLTDNYGKNSIQFVLLNNTQHFHNYFVQVHVDLVKKSIKTVNEKLSKFGVEYENT